MKPVIAIDPGVGGGVVWGASTTRASASAMPKTAIDLRDLLVEIQKELGPDATAYMEMVGGHIAGEGRPGSAMFTFGENAGVLNGILATLSIPLERPTPQKWQKALSLGTRGPLSKDQWKNKLKRKAQDLYPGHKITLKTADAFLIYHAAQKGLI